jgi:hypothetical protein
MAVESIKRLTMTVRGVLRWLADNGIDTTRMRIKWAHEMGYVAAPEKNDSGQYDYSQLDLVRLKAYFEDRQARPGAWRKT